MPSVTGMLVIHIVRQNNAFIASFSALFPRAPSLTYNCYPRSGVCTLSGEGEVGCGVGQGYLPSDPKLNVVEQRLGSSTTATRENITSTWEYFLQHSAAVMSSLHLYCTRRLTRY